MGDRAIIQFAQRGEIIGGVYLHNGGSQADEILAEFFVAEEENPRHDNRFNDAPYLAARFVAWASRPNGLGIGVQNEAGDASNTWRVHCNSSQRPRVENVG
jgi:hypothetical protein